MRKVLTLILAVGALAGCDDPDAPDLIKSSGAHVVEVRAMPLVRSVVMRDNVQLELVAGLAAPELAGPRNVLGKIRLDYGHGRLTVSNGNTFKWVRAYKDVRLRLPSDSVVEIVQEGYGEVFSTDTLRGAEVRLALYGNTAMRLAVVADAVALDVNGQGDLQLAGSVRYAYVALRKYASLNGAGFHTRLADVEQDGAGDATLQIQDSVFVRQQGPGCLKVLRRPKVGFDQANAPCVEEL